MATTLEELERRVVALEQEVAELRGTAELLKVARLGDNIPMIREARAQQAAISAIAEKVFAVMGVTGPPVGHEKLREMLKASAIDQNDNAFTREVIAMREE